MKNNEERTWPVALGLVIAIVFPIVCVLWFMVNAIHNERMASRQRIQDLYRDHLSQARHQLRSYWFEKIASLDRLSRTKAIQSPGQLFRNAVDSRISDALILLDDTESAIFPPHRGEMPILPLPWTMAWQQAEDLEYKDGNRIAAIEAYEKLAETIADPHIRARALVAQARNYWQLNEAEIAINILTETLANPEFIDALDSRGGLVVPAASLMALNIMPKNHLAYQRTRLRLETAIFNYERPLMPSAQRRFLYKNLLQLGEPTVSNHRVLDAETLVMDMLPFTFPVGSSLQKAPKEGIFMLRSGNLVALFKESNLIEDMFAFAHIGLDEDAHTKMMVLPPGRSSGQEDVLTSLPISESALPGWRLALIPDDETAIEAVDEVAASRISLYYWSGSLVVVTLFALAFAIARYHHMQMRLTRMKNDLVATVSHELKTPLSSMRMLVETLLDGHYTDPKLTRDYLDLIYKENVRLSRLIENFLTFSRLERKRHNFSFDEIDMNACINAAIASVEEKFRSGGFSLEVDLATGLPPIVADEGAFVTVIINLMDNAYKYSGGSQTVEVKTFLDNECVCLSVRDAGIGLSRRDIRKIFTRFYRVDQSLSRKSDGVGLGLNIVQYILAAHFGKIDVKSQLNEGSTFTVRMPMIGSAVCKKLMRQAYGH